MLIMDFLPQSCSFHAFYAQPCGEIYRLKRPVDYNWSSLHKEETKKKKKQKNSQKRAGKQKHRDVHHSMNHTFLENVGEALRAIQHRREVRPSLRAETECDLHNGFCAVHAACEHAAALWSSKKEKKRKSLKPAQTCGHALVLQLDVRGGGVCRCWRVWLTDACVKVKRWNVTVHSDRGILFTAAASYTENGLLYIWMGDPQRENVLMQSHQTGAPQKRSSGRTPGLATKMENKQMRLLYLEKGKESASQRGCLQFPWPRRREATSYKQNHSLNKLTKQNSLQSAASRCLKTKQTKKPRHKQESSCFWQPGRYS